jgi:hypothetical protein
VRWFDSTRGRQKECLRDGETGNSSRVQDFELIAEEVSDLGQRLTILENRLSDILVRLQDVERVNTRLEGAALTTARALAEIAGHWDAVYEAMRREDTSEESPEI